MRKENIGILLITISGVATLTAVLIQSPIAQDLAYHHFSDTVSLFNIPNTINALSNLPFFIIVLLGLQKLLISN